MAFAVLMKGRPPKLMGALASPPIFKTTKSTGTYDCLTRTMAIQGHVLITYAIDGEVNYNQYSTHNRGKSKGKCIYE